MRHSFVLIALVSSLVWACGGSDKPIQQPDQPELPKVKKPNETTGGDQPGGAGGAVTAAPDKVKYDVDFVEAKPSEEIKSPPRISIDVPGIEQVIPMANVKSARVLFKLQGMNELPEGSFVQLVLDGRPYEPVLSASDKVTLTDLAGGEALTEGEHIIAGFVCRPNRECIKSEKSISVRRFFVGKKTAGGWNPHKDPLLIVGSPYGQYSSDVLVDWYVLNAMMGRNDFSLRVLIEGPGVKPEGIQRVITEWRPWVVFSAHDGGSYTVKFDLLDPNGELVPYGSLTRTFTMRRD